LLEFRGEHTLVPIDEDRHMTDRLDLVVVGQVLVTATVLLRRLDGSSQRLEGGMGYGNLPFVR
jgi:hypothetical protein